LEIRDVQRNVDELLKNGPKIGEAAEKLNNLSSIFDDAESRVESIQSARTGIGHAEARLQELNAEIDKKFKTLQTITAAQAQKDTSKASVKTNRVTPNIKEQVKLLVRQGWKIPEISKSLNLTESEVELILELEDDSRD
jgi:type VII secretion effector (TIGR04197 family)